MDFRYLRYLAESGTANIHPGGIGLTRSLINSLNIKKSDRILEIGCGTGETMIRIASQFDVNITGIDFLSEMLDVSRRRIKFTGVSNSVTVLEHDIKKPFPFESNRFDIVYLESALCFHDFSTVTNILKEAHRVMKQGATFAALETVWLNNVFPEKVSIINSNSERDFGLRPASNDVLSLEGWLDLFQKHGFDIISYDIATPQIANLKYSVNYKLIKSKLLTLRKKTIKIFNPVYIKEYLNYRKVLKNHKTSERTMETRLFLLRKKNF